MNVIRARKLDAADPRARWFVLAISCIALFMAVLDNLVVNVALPKISDDLKPTTSQLQWIMSGYVLIFASLQITAGSLGDRLGRKRFFIIGTIIFTVTSALAAFVPSTGWLIAARAAQGLGAAFIMPLSLSIISAAFPPAERGKAIGIWSAISMSGVAIGPIVGGVIINLSSWHWIFLINVPIGLVTIIGSYLVLQETLDESGHTATDIPGTITVTAAIASLTWALIQAGERGWSDALVIAAILASVVLGAIFAVIETRSEHPMVPMRFFKSRNFSGANVVALGNSFLVSGLAFALTLYFQNVHGYSALRTGFTMLPSVIPMMIIGAVAGSLMIKLGARNMITVGMVVSALGMYLLTLAGVDTPFLQLVPALVVFGVGSGLVFAPMMTALMNSVPTSKGGVASAVNGAIRETGFAFGIALLGTIMGQKYQSSLTSSEEFSRLRDTTGNPRFAAIQPVLDTIEKGVNFGGQVIEDTSIFPGLPASITEPIRIASSRAFMAGMEQAFLVATALTLIATVAAWLLIRNDVPVEQQESETEVDQAYGTEPSTAD